MGDLTNNFSKWEFACKCGCGFNEIDPELADQVQRLRNLLWTTTGKEIPITVTCGCRCPAHNAAIGGVQNSFHTQGLAVDITFSHINVLVGGRIVYLANRFKILKIGAIGVYPDRNFMHLDVRPQKRELIIPVLYKAKKFPYVGPITTWINEDNQYHYGVDFSEFSWKS